MGAYSRVIILLAGISYDSVVPQQLMPGKVFEVRSLLIELDYSITHTIHIVNLYPWSNLVF
jgi:hypothetical protein